MEKVQNFRNVFNDPVFWYVQFQKRFSCQTELTSLLLCRMPKFYKVTGSLKFYWLVMFKYFMPCFHIWKLVLEEKTLKIWEKSYWVAFRFPQGIQHSTECQSSCTRWTTATRSTIPMEMRLDMETKISWMTWCKTGKRTNFSIFLKTHPRIFF